MGKRSPSTPGTPKIRLGGKIDESIDLQAVLVPQDGKLFVDFSKLEKINSVGVRNLMIALKELRAQGVHITVSPCSANLVELWNMIPGLFSPGEVQSVLAPFTCRKCGSAFFVEYQVQDLKASLQGKEEASCPSCQSPSELEVYPEEFFAFLREA